MFFKLALLTCYLLRHLSPTQRQPSDYIHAEGCNQIPHRLLLDSVLSQNAIAIIMTIIPPFFFPFTFFLFSFVLFDEVIILGAYLLKLHNFQRERIPS